ncbi:lipoprotein HlpB [Rodentibacter caecimuris]|uniref:lipoprotein HlpB n=1 Tax=Rodentibacter caecimuris TaxID=1796644 RepID=UPI0010947946|nr:MULTISPECIES: lipoprotein HlpB [Pasteurellaceae]MCR1837800.1 lipoprotein HlpB [Pasteurella caecimuris]MCU0106423.1 lipoprotein HlpB [Pasteurella caecimuris]MCX2960462.1 lipoprotein HlpB [Rodentibacter heylii]TGY49384.1 lipoprotein HlpB [Pasteurella caecimuris]
MNKLTKITATALFALFLTACDKADKTTDTAKPETAQQTEAAKAAEAAPAMSAEAQEKADYEKLIAWNQEQGVVQAQNQQKLQQELNAAAEAKDENKAKAAIEAFNKTVQASIASLDALDLKSDLIGSAKNQTKEVLTLASQLLVAQANVKTEADQKAYAEKAAELQNKMQSLAELGAQIEAKFNPAPVQPAAPNAEQPAQAPAAK